jgi:hypothetical protein
LTPTILALPGVVQECSPACNEPPYYAQGQPPWLAPPRLPLPRLCDTPCGVLRWSAPAPVGGIALVQLPDQFRLVAIAHLEVNNRGVDLGDQEVAALGHRPGLSVRSDAVRRASTTARALRNAAWSSTSAARFTILLPNPRASLLPGTTFLRPSRPVSSAGRASPPGSCFSPPASGRPCAGAASRSTPRATGAGLSRRWIAPRPPAPGSPLGAG